MYDIYEKKYALELILTCKVIELKYKTTGIRPCPNCAHAVLTVTFPRYFVKFYRVNCVLYPLGYKPVEIKV